MKLEFWKNCKYTCNNCWFFDNNLICKKVDTKFIIKKDLSTSAVDDEINAASFNTVATSGYEKQFFFKIFVEMWLFISTMFMCVMTWYAVLLQQTCRILFVFAIYNQQCSKST